MNREITNKNLHLLLPGKVSFFAKIYTEERGGGGETCWMLFVPFTNQILIRLWNKKKQNYGTTAR